MIISQVYQLIHESVLNKAIESVFHSFHFKAKTEEDALNELFKPSGYLHSKLLSIAQFKNMKTDDFTEFLETLKSKVIIDHDKYFNGKTLNTKEFGKLIKDESIANGNPILTGVGKHIDKFNNPNILNTINDHPYATGAGITGSTLAGIGVTTYKADPQVIISPPIKPPTGRLNQPLEDQIGRFPAKDTLDDISNSQVNNVVNNTKDIKDAIKTQPQFPYHDELINGAIGLGIAGAGAYVTYNYLKNKRFKNGY